MLNNSYFAYIKHFEMFKLLVILTLFGIFSISLQLFLKQISSFELNISEFYFFNS